MLPILGKSWKLVIAAAAALQVVAFFAPFLRYRIADLDVAVSAYRIAAGFGRADLIDPQFGPFADPRDEARFVADVNDRIGRDRIVQLRYGEPLPPRRSFVPFYFLSGFALAVLALRAAARRELSWIAGIGALALGGVALWGWSRELLIDRGSSLSQTALGASLLGVSGLLALIAGIGVMIVPDPGTRERKRRIELARARLVQR